MTNDKIRQWIEEEMGTEEEVVLFECPSYADAFIGVDTTAEFPRAVYEYEKMIAHLINETEMDHDEAIEFYYYNTERAVQYIDVKKRPILMFEFVNYFDDHPSMTEPSGKEFILDFDPDKIPKQ